MDGERLEKESDFLYEGCSPDRQVVHASDEHGSGVWFLVWCCGLCSLGVGRFCFEEGS